MRSIPFSVTIASCFLFVATGCSNASDSETLTWITGSDSSPDAPDEEMSSYVRANVSDIEEEYGFPMQHSIHTTNIDEAMARLLEQAVRGQAPDFALVDGYALERFEDQLQPLNELMDEYGMDLDDFLPFAQDVMVGDDGNVYGLYLSTDVRYVFYDTRFVPEPPETWDDAMDISHELVDQGYEGLVLPLGVGEGTSVTSLLPLFWGQGGELIDEEGRPAFYNSENREYMLNVFNSIYEGVESGAITKRMASNGTENDGNAEISTGLVKMLYPGTWQINTFQEILGDDFEHWDVASLPTLEGGEPTSTVGGWAFGIFTEDPEKQRAAFDFLQRTYVGEEGMARFTTRDGSMPVRASVYDSPEFEAIPFIDEFQEILEKEGRPRPAEQVYNTISVQLQIAISQVVSGSKTPEEALDDAWEIVTFGMEDVE
ncbi:extracellular solute-binding protein [Alkalicoccobacillus porphyridii]|uniref:Extracellular solute-binding protein n=1 Tax=Alkalicoccobacillus porphyridii TaxID=2597270 RepID=A0A553ZVU4_9BACI|nr:extracellular solute-binding protein [Alkalicoccobacillus porphyridii]TSB45594.1 extracellular solute-binding protein [Alkalicoccobacillus porphyridii]